MGAPGVACVRRETMMKIHILLSNRETYTYVVKSEERARDLLNEIVPPKLFSRQRLIIQGATSVSGFACPHVEWVEFETEHAPPWAYINQGIERLERISETEFQELIVRQSAGANEDEIFAEFVMRSGRHLFVRIMLVSESAGGFRQLIAHLLDGGGFDVMDDDSGRRLIVNPSNIARWNVHPAPKTPLPEQFAWMANFQRVD